MRPCRARRHDDERAPRTPRLIIAPDDGRVLGAETLLTETAGALNVPVPSVIGYTTFRSGRYTDDLR